MDKEQIEKRRAVLRESLARIEQEIKNLRAGLEARVNQANAVKGGIAEWDKALEDLEAADAPDTPSEDN